MRLTRRTLLAAAGAAALSRPTGAAAQAASADLVAAARKEGEVVWYTTLIVNQAVRPLVDAFEKTYPGVKVRFVPGPPVETATRILNEAKAGAVKADVFDGGSTFFPLHAAKLVTKYIPEAAKEWPAEYRDAEGYWTASNLYVLSPVINTDQVDPKDAPRSFEDLLAPRWKGRMAWPDTPSASGPAGVIGNVLLSMGQEAGMAYLRKLAEQKIANVPAVQRVVLDQCIAGEYPLVLSVYNNHADISAAQGAPVKWLVMEPMVVTFGMAGILEDAPHPNAAKLLIEFLLGEPGQNVLREAGYLPVNPLVKPTTPELLPAFGKFKAQVISPALFERNERDWLKISEDLFH
ncbi:ABC transporter substrate-binding protein [Chelatococcus sp. GCM10030263]|uniref:ABC transporter substrate-binding protein n=1 Tax=Chelatococcus sp. GCM10030263 TaxID=3273387 RepID=UPI003618D8C1